MSTKGGVTGIRTALQRVLGPMPSRRPAHEASVRLCTTALSALVACAPRTPTRPLRQNEALRAAPHRTATARWIDVVLPHEIGSREFSLTTLADGSVLLIGGCKGTMAGDGCAAVSTARYDPSHDRWTSTAPSGQEHHAGCSTRLLADGRVLVVEQYVHDNGEIYDPRQDEWSRVTRDAALRSFECDGGALVALPDGSSLKFGNQVCRLNPARREWNLVATTMPDERNHCGAATLRDGRVLVTGGLPPSDGVMQALSDSFLFDPRALSWTPVAAMPHSRRDHTMTLLPDGRVLVAGGYESYGSSDARQVRAIDLYDPAQDTWRIVAEPANEHPRWEWELSPPWLDLLAVDPNQVLLVWEDSPSLGLLDIARGTHRSVEVPHGSRAAVLRDGNVLVVHAPP